MLNNMYTLFSVSQLCSETSPNQAFHKQKSKPAPRSNFLLFSRFDLIWSESEFSLNKSV